MSFVTVEIEQRGFRRLQTMFSLRKRSAVKRALAQANVRSGVMLLHTIQRNIQAQGLVRTGAYLNSWKIVVSNGGNTVQVSTDHPAARRLEYGFVGRDAMGRLYNDRPRPHVRPALGVVRGKTFSGAHAAIVEELK